MKDLICITCPKGCHLKIDEENDFSVTGAGCEKGQEYGKKELTNPTRVVTSTVKIRGGLYARLPVKTDSDIKKGDIFAAVKLLESVEVTSPIKVGDVVLGKILGTAVNFVATRDM